MPWSAEAGGRQPWDTRAPCSAVYPARSVAHLEGFKAAGPPIPTARNRPFLSWPFPEPFLVLLRLFPEEPAAHGSGRRGAGRTRPGGRAPKANSGSDGKPKICPSRPSVPGTDRQWREQGHHVSVSHYGVSASPPSKHTRSSGSCANPAAEPAASAPRALGAPGTPTVLHSSKSPAQLLRSSQPCGLPAHSSLCPSIPVSLSVNPSLLGFLSFTKGPISLALLNVSLPAQTRALPRYRRDPPGSALVSLALVSSARLSSAAGRGKGRARRAPRNRPRLSSLPPCSGRASRRGAPPGLIALDPDGDPTAVPPVQPPQCRRPKPPWGRHPRLGPCRGWAPAPLLTCLLERVPARACLRRGGPTVPPLQRDPNRGGVQRGRSRRARQPPRDPRKERLLRLRVLGWPRARNSGCSHSPCHPCSGGIRLPGVFPARQLRARDVAALSKPQTNWGGKSPGSVPSHGLRSRQFRLLLLVLPRGGQSSALATASPSAPKSWKRLSPGGMRRHPVKASKGHSGHQVDTQAGFPGTGLTVRGCRAHLLVWNKDYRSESPGRRQGQPAELDRGWPCVLRAGVASPPAKRAGLSSRCCPGWGRGVPGSSCAHG